MPKLVHRFFYALVLVCSLSGAAELRPADIQALPHKEVVRILPASHPSAYYLYAARLFQEGSKEDAVFWLYVGELRYRFLLAANPKSAPDQDPALFSSLHENIGSTINEWAGAEPDSWAKQMRRALDWDAHTDNGFTSKVAHAKEWRETRDGLQTLEAWVSSNKASILVKRKKNGL